MNCLFCSVLRAKMRLATTAAAAAVPIIQFSLIQRSFLPIFVGLLNKPSVQFP